MNRSYRKFESLPTFIERFDYLKLRGSVGVSTFGSDRYLNQVLYTSSEWRSVRNQVIIRDNGCDLGLDGYQIYSKILVHHMNPITIDDITARRRVVFDLDGLICVTNETHQAIHYGDENLLRKDPVIRRSGDTCPWSKK